ncbi:MAG: ribonuclease Z [Bacteroidales bacterium]|nr:ribonuclease Z [Bacteroidales bacterium]
MTFSLTILGSGSAIPTLTRNPSAQLLNVHEKIFLIDCAEGTQLQLKKFKFRLQKIDHIFISHLHGDHFFGLIGLISTLHLLGRKNEMHVYAPAELEEIIDIQFKASGTILRFPLIFHYLHQKTSEIIYEDKNIKLRSFPLNHSIPTWGFVFREKQKERNIRKDFIIEKNIPVTEILKIKKGEDYVDENGKIYKNPEITLNPQEPRSYAYCSDTRYFEPVIPFIKDVDVLFHEATFMQDKVKNAIENFHSTAIEAATIAKKAGVNKLIIGHYSARYKNAELLLSEAKSIFPNTILAEDGLKVDMDIKRY